VLNVWKRGTDALDLPLEPGPGGVVDAAPDLFAEAFDKLLKAVERSSK